MIDFFKPELVITNISNKDVRILGRFTIKPRQTIDIFDATEPSELFEDTIIKALEKPWGDLYRETVVKKSIIIDSIDLSSFHYAAVSPPNIVSINQPFDGSILSINDEKFEWISSSIANSYAPPLYVSGNVVNINKADAYTDGFLSKEDYLTFSTAAIEQRLPIRIWQYQDFPAPVSSAITLTNFENGSGMPFNAALIIDDTASIVLVSDTETPPTTTTSIPGKWLPSNRVQVSSHINDIVILNQTPNSIFVCRVYFLIGVPLGTSLPSNYQEAPKFVRRQRLEFIDAAYVNQEGDEQIYGIKTFENNVIINGNLGINKIPIADLDIDGLIKTTDFQLTIDPSDGYFLKSDSIGAATWATIPEQSIIPPSPYPGKLWMKIPDYEVFSYDATRTKWISTRTISVSASRNSERATNIYLYGSGNTSTYVAPLIIPYNSTILSITASGKKIQSWTASVRKNNSLLDIASLPIITSKVASSLNLNVDVVANDGIQIYLDGMNISYPKVNIFLARSF